VNSKRQRDAKNTKRKGNAAGDFWGGAMGPCLSQLLASNELKKKGRWTVRGDMGSVGPTDWGGEKTFSREEFDDGEGRKIRDCHPNSDWGWRELNWAGTRVDSKRVKGVYCLNRASYSQMEGERKSTGSAKPLWTGTA